MSPVKVVDAVEVLREASAVALKEPDVAPRAGQFVYTKFADGRRVWQAADGSQDGVVENGDGTRAVLQTCRNGQSGMLDKSGAPVTGRAEPCGECGGLQPEPAYRRGHVAAFFERQLAWCPPWRPRWPTLFDERRRGYVTDGSIYPDLA